MTQAYGGLLGYPWSGRPRCCRHTARPARTRPAGSSCMPGWCRRRRCRSSPPICAGSRSAGLIPVYFGNAGEAERALGPLRALVHTAALDMVRPMSYQQVQQLTGGARPGRHASLLHRGVAARPGRPDDRGAGGRGRRCPVTVFGDHHQADGRSHCPGSRRRPPFWYRDAAHNLDIHAQWAPGGPPGPHIAWARAARQAAQRDSAGGGYVNFIGADQGHEPGPRGVRRQLHPAGPGQGRLRPRQFLSPQQQHPAGRSRRETGSGATAGAS